MILTPAQRRAFERGQAAANDVRPIVEYLERVATDVPHVAERTAELRTRMDYLTNMCESCIAADHVSN